MASAGAEASQEASGRGAAAMLGGGQPAAHAVLGLLLLAEREAGGSGAGYGYDLARHFGAGQPLAEVIHLEPGMLYHHLKRLDRAGLVEGWLEPQGTRPPRQVYRLTPAGREELARWLAEPVARTREIRLDFLIKLYFARRLDPALATRLQREQRDRLRQLEASLAEQVERHDQITESGRPAEPAPPHDDRTFTRAVLELRLAQTRAALTWLERLAAGQI